MRIRCTLLALPLLLASPLGAQSWTSSDPRVVRVDSATGSAADLTTGAAGRAEIVYRNRAGSRIARATVTVPARVDTVWRVDTVYAARPDSAPAPLPTVGAAALPRDSVDVTWPRMTLGVWRTVRPGESLQAAIDAAPAGAEIAVDPGVVASNIVLRARGDSGWVVIRAATVRAPAGTRVSPADSVWMPRIVSTGSNEPAIRTQGAARGWRLVGLHVTQQPGAVVGSLVAINGHQATTLDAMPGRIVLDRLLVRSRPELEVRRCVTLNGARLALVDSWLGECHARGADAQAVLVYAGPGPYRIENNYLEGSGENILLGGADSRSADLSPADITIRRNHIAKPAAWRPTWDAATRQWVNHKWLVKNLVECKDGERILIEGNVIEGVWPHGQTGFAIVCKSVNQDGSAPWSETSDVTVRCNIIRDAAGAVSLAGRPETHPAVPMARVTFAHNVIERIGVEPNTVGRLWQINAVADVTLDRNTTSAPHTALYLLGAAGSSPRLTVTGNVFSRSLYGIYSDGSGGGTRALDGKATPWTFAGNSLPGVTASAYPAGNSYDGTIPSGAGADSARVAACTAGVVE